MYKQKVKEVLLNFRVLYCRYTFNNKNRVSKIYF